MADPNRFGGEVKVILKGNSEPFIMQQSHAFSDECRGLGVAEMAWSMRLGRKNRANKEMAYHALEVLHGIVKSSEMKSTQVIQSTFEKMPPIPRGYSGQGYFEFVEETFDDVALLIQGSIIPGSGVAAGMGRNDWNHPAFFQPRASGAVR